MQCNATYLGEFDRPRVIRLIGDGWPVIDPPNDLPLAVLEAALHVWPKDLVADYFMTPGGFLTFDWPKEFSVNDVKRPTRKEMRTLVRAASHTCDQFMSRFESAFLREKMRSLTLGVDGECDKSGQHAELILFKDLRSGEAHWTGKSYPIAEQERLLVCFDDLRTHLINTSKDRVLVLGNHDLNLLSNRALLNTGYQSWKNLRIIEFRRLATDFRPTIALHLAHTTDTPRIWRTAWSGLRQTLPSVHTYAGAGRWYNPLGSRRGGILETLKANAKGRVSTFLIRITAYCSGPRSRPEEDTDQR